MKTIKFLTILAMVSFFTMSSVNAQNLGGKVPELALKAVTQYAVVNHHKIGYRKFGKGAPVIVTNRFRGTLDTWDPLFLDLLAQQNTVII